MQEERTMIAELRALYYSIKRKWQIIWIGFWLKESNAVSERRSLLPSIEEVSFQYITEYHKISKCGCAYCSKERGIANNFYENINEVNVDMDVSSHQSVGESGIIILNKCDRDAVANRMQRQWLLN